MPRAQPKPCGRVFLVVGHSNWGKSATLRALTDGSPDARSCMIARRWLLVHRMSNDDVPTPSRRHRSFHLRVRALRPATVPNAIVAFCPNPDAPEKKTLAALGRRYRLYAFVLKYRYRGDPMRAAEYRWLREFATPTVYRKRSEAGRRATALRRFIERTFRRG